MQRFQGLPPTLLLIYPAARQELLSQHAPWLNQAESIILLRDPLGYEEALEDPELMELIEEERLKQIASLERLRGHFEWSEQAEALAEAERWAYLSAPFPQPAPDWSLHQSPPGPWLSWPTSRWAEDEPRRLACSLCHREGRPQLLDPSLGLRLDLLSGQRSSLHGDFGEPYFWAVSPDARGLLLPGTKRSSWRWLELASGEVQEINGAWGRPIGFDPTGRYAWAGGRCFFHWLSVIEGQPCYLGQSSHDWPCGHEKKQYGYLDNEPRWIHLSPDLSAYLSIYDKDAIISSSIPVQWCQAGPYLFACRADDSLRALFFTRRETAESYPANPMDPFDGEARDAAPTVLLGPSSSARYLLSFEEPVYRLQGEEVVQLGGPDERYALFDSQHQMRAQRQGRLLGGWWRWAFVVEGGQIFREEIESGVRVELGTAELGCKGVPIPGSQNFLLYQRSEKTLRIRLI